jgi:hypothetical protein
MRSNYKYWVVIRFVNQIGEYFMKRGKHAKFVLKERFIKTCSSIATGPTLWAKRRDKSNQKGSNGSKRRASKRKKEEGRWVGEEEKERTLG